MSNTAPLPHPSPSAISDEGRIRLGGGYRLPMPVPPEVSDTGRIRLGGGYRLPADRAAC